MQGPEEPVVPISTARTRVAKGGYDHWMSKSETVFKGEFHMRKDEASCLADVFEPIVPSV